jgi:hypothetical protein
MSESKRKIFTGAQKAKVALEAVRGKVDPEIRTVV